jgi:arylsulfatase A
MQPTVTKHMNTALTAKPGVEAVGARFYNDKQSARGGYGIKREEKGSEMKRREFLKAAAAGLSTLGLGSEASAAAQRAGKPNILLIMVDDLGYECLGSYGSKEYETPHLDELARTGLRFTHCYSQPLCTPSRVQIMTGRYNHRNYKAFGYLDPAEVTFGNVLRDAGYATCIAGKWQLNGIEEFPNWEDASRPVHFGFDEYCLWQLTKKRNEGERYANPLVEQSGQPATLRSDQYGPDVFCDYLLDFVERKSGQPFFAYYPMALTHCPFWPTPDSPAWADPSARRPGHEYWGEAENFGDMVKYMDKTVGRLVQKLDALGIRDDTLIIFTTDNGTDKPITSKLGDRNIKGGKGEFTDAGTRVPLIINWRGTTPSGVVYDDLIDFSDFLPTLAEAAGAAMPSDRIIDGHSFFPRIRGEKGNPREWVFCHYWGNGRKKAEAREFVRDKRWKLYDNGDLYDLNADIDEKTPIVKMSTETEAAQQRLQGAFETVRQRN